MRAINLSISRRFPIQRLAQWLASWLGKHRPALRLAGCFLSVSFATAFAFLLCRMQGGPNLIWIANGVLLAYLLLAPRWRWPAYLAVGYAAQMVGGMIVAHNLSMSLALPVLGVGEAAIAAFLLRRRSLQLPNFIDPDYLLRFGLYALLAAPIATGAIFAVISPLWFHLKSTQAFFGWAEVDALGIAVATPACVAALRTHWMMRVHSKQSWLLAASLASVTFLSFSRPSLPLGAVIYPLLLLVLLTSGLPQAALATLFVAAVGGWYTTRGVGMLALSNFPGAVSPIFRLQLFIASALFMLYAVSLVIERQKATERRLQKLASLYTLLTDNSRDAIIISDFHGDRTYVSVTPALQRLIGWTSRELMRHNSYEMLHPEDREKAAQMVRELFTGAGSTIFECRVRRQQGDYLWVESVLSLVRNPKSGAPTGILNIVRDISARKRTELSREFHLSLNRAIHEVSLDGILVVNDEGIVVSLNKRFQEVWLPSSSPANAGLAAESIGFSDEKLLPTVAGLVNDPDAFVARVRELYADPYANDQSLIELKDGRTLERYSTGLRGENGQYLGRAWFFRDITKQQQAEERLRQAYHTVEALAATDPLTGLANRRRFDQCLSNEWRRGLRDQTPLSMLLIDVDLFKSYNDFYGHLLGDTCLKQIAEAAMSGVTRPGDLVARFGGEEFAVILPHTNSKGAIEVAQAICDALRRRKIPHQDNPTGVITVSAGCVTMVPALGQNARNLIAMADEALYRAKHRGRNQVCIWNDPHQAPDKHSLIA